MKGTWHCLAAGSSNPEAHPTSGLHGGINLWKPFLFELAESILTQQCLFRVLNLPLHFAFSLNVILSHIFPFDPH